MHQITETLVHSGVNKLCATWNYIGEEDLELLQTQHAFACSVYRNGKRLIWVKDCMLLVLLIVQI